MTQKPKKKKRGPSHYPRFTDALIPCNVPTQRCGVSREQAEKRILIMRVGAFGDIIMGTPLLAALREAYPTAHITWIAEHTENQAIDANPYVDEVIIWDTRFWKRMVRRVNYGLWLLKMLKFRRDLHDRDYDIFISFQPEEWPLLARNTGAPIRVGIFDTFARYYGKPYAGSRTQIYTSAYTHKELPPHRVDQYLLTLDALGLPKDNVSQQMSLGYTAEDAAAVEPFLRQNGLGTEVGGAPYVLLAPFTTWPTKCWPAERFVELADALEREGYRILLTGSPKEIEGVAELAGKFRTPPATAAGIFTFRQMAALLDRASLVVCGDTGPLHAAAALNTPYVGLFGPTSASWYGPRAGRGQLLWHSVPCGPCDQKFCPNKGETFEICMRLLSVEEVTRTALDLLKRYASLAQHSEPLSEFPVAVPVLQASE